MNIKKKARIVDACIENIREGIISKEQLLMEYPDLAEEIQSALLIIDSISGIAFSAEEKFNPRVQKVNLLQKLPDREGIVTKHMDHRYRLHNLKRRFMMTWVIIVTTILSLVSGAGAVYASGEALPGDILYPVKMWTENVQLAIAPDDIDVDLYSRFADNRIEEAAKLIQAGRSEDFGEIAAGYQQQSELLSKTMARIQADSPDDAVKLRLELEEKLQVQARLMQSLVVEDGNNAENSDRLQEQIRLMLETNTQLRLRINEVEIVPVEETEGSGADAETTMDEISVEAGKNAAAKNEGGTPSLLANDEIGTLTFGLGGSGGNGVYAEVNGLRYDCGVENDTATCNLTGAPQSGNVKLLDRQTNQLLYSYSYEFKQAHGYKWEGENKDKENAGENIKDSEGGMKANEKGIGK